VTDIYAVVFDMDGVLIDSHATHLKAWRRFLQGEGISASDDELAYVLEGRTRTEILRHFLGELDANQFQIYGRRKDEIFRSLEHEIAPVPGVLDFVKNLMQWGLALAVATSASEIRTFSTIERLGLGGSFQAVVTAGDVVLGKPDPAVYRLACEHLRIEGERALAFDDAPAGIEAARAAGMRCVGVQNNGAGQALQRAGAEWIIPSFACDEFTALETRLRTQVRSRQAA
jgi:beta-phosphoglucomutase